MYTAASVTMETLVTIVGGSLSGLALSRELALSGIGHVVLEASPVGRSPAIYYLTSRSAAKNLGIEERYDEAAQIREPITGYVRYDGTKPHIEPLEELRPKAEGRDGFVTFSLEEITQWLSSNSPYILRDRSANHLEMNGPNWRVYTTNEEVFQTKVVIDATGSRARVLSKLYGDGLESLVKNRLVRACYGGIFPYEGPENILMTVDNFPPIESDIPREGAGGIIPLGKGFAYMLVGLEANLKDISAWYSPKLDQLLQSYAEWFNNRGKGQGIKINFEGRDFVAGSFSQGLLDYRHIPTKLGLAAFGESLGLNQPLHGYLIKDIAFYAKVMAHEISKYLDGGDWNPHQMLVANSPINFGLQMALGNRKVQSVLNGRGRSAATKKLQEFLVSALGEDGFWHAIDNGLSPKGILFGLIRNPKYLGVVSSLALDYLRLLANDGLYREELGLKIQNHLFHRYRHGHNS